MTESTTSNSGYAGQVGLGANAGERYNELYAMIFTILGRVQTMALVEVMAVTNAGGVEPVGFVDVKPMVNQVDGVGKSTPHATIFGVPYTRIQGGARAIIMDPVVGDVGWMACSARDISSVKSTRAAANPGSKRRFDLADGVYMGGTLNAAPTSYVAFTDGGITMTPDSGATSITLTPGLVRIVADRIQTHALVENSWDAFGTGFVYTAGAIHFFTTGVPSTTSVPTPPEVPT